MKNRNLSRILQIIGWTTIVYNAWLLGSSITTTNDLSGTVLDLFIVLLIALLNFPYLYIGIFLIWLGKRLNTNDTKADDDENHPNKKLAAEGTKTFGWVIVLLASFYTLLGFSITNDAEGQAYRPLLVTPGIIGIVIGGLILWRGMRSQKKDNG